MKSDNITILLRNANLDCIGNKKKYEFLNLLNELFIINNFIFRDVHQFFGKKVCIFGSRFGLELKYLIYKTIDTKQ